MPTVSSAAEQSARKELIRAIQSIKGAEDLNLAIDAIIHLKDNPQAFKSAMGRLKTEDPNSSSVAAMELINSALDMGDCVEIPIDVFEKWKESIDHA